MPRSISKLTCNSRRFVLMSLIALAYLGVGWLSLAGVKTGAMRAAHAQSSPAASSSSPAIQARATVTPEAYDSWPLLVNPFESTGGGGIMIDRYAPTIDGSICRTDFTATPPGGPTYHNSVEWTAVAVQGGTLCKDGQWHAKDGSASGTTPFQVFIKDGLVRRMP